MNKTITIPYTLPRATALVLGSARYGDGELEVTDAQLAELTAAEALLVAEGRRLVLAALPSWEVVHGALAAAVAQAAETAAIRREQAERAAREALELPLSAWLDSTGQVRCPWIANLDQLDPRIVARRAEAHAGGAPRRAEVEGFVRAAKEREEAAAARRRAEEEQEKRDGVAFVEACRTFALGVPQLARAAEEKYDVTAAVVRYVADQIADEGARAFIVDGSKHWDSYGWHVAKAPSPAAFTLHDAVAERIAKVAVPPGLLVTLERIMHVSQTVTLDDGDEEEADFEGVVVRLRAPDQAKCALVFNAEW